MKRIRVECIQGRKRSPPRAQAEMTGGIGDPGSRQGLEACVFSPESPLTGPTPSRFSKLTVPCWVPCGNRYQVPRYPHWILKGPLGRADAVMVFGRHSRGIRRSI